MTPFDPPEDARSRTERETPPKTVLFLCTGNYYRSRFAEVDEDGDVRVWAERE